MMEAGLMKTNLKDTDKVTLTFGQIQQLVKESKGRKVLKESYNQSAESIIDELRERAQDIVNEAAEYGEEPDIGEAVAEAIDQGLIYTSDIITLLQHYGTISDQQIIESYYEDLFSDVSRDIEEPETKDDDDEIGHLDSDGIEGEE